MYDTFLTSIPGLENITNSVLDSTFVNKVFDIEQFEISPDEIFKMAKSSFTKYFFIINPLSETDMGEFNFAIETDNHTIVSHWGNFSVRLYHRDSVLENPAKFADASLKAGECNKRDCGSGNIKSKELDVAFLSYDEENIDQNLNDLKMRANTVRHVSKVQGIYRAHRAAAELAKSVLFYVVDADAKILDDFNFEYAPNIYDAYTTHVWRARNVVNDLEYGYGGVKLFNRAQVLNYTGLPVDFTTSVSSKFKIMPQISNLTAFNTSAFSAWRSGFRECTKLASAIIKGGNSMENEKRLSVWCTEGQNRQFGQYAISGATAGKEYGSLYANDPTMLAKINDYEWLSDTFRVTLESTD